MLGHDTCHNGVYFYHSGCTRQPNDKDKRKEKDMSTDPYSSQIENPPENPDGQTIEDYVAWLEKANQVLESENLALREQVVRYKKLCAIAKKKTAYDVYGAGCHWSIGFFSDDQNVPLDAAIDSLPPLQR
jgi:hypothetical protein